MPCKLQKVQFTLKDTSRNWYAAVWLRWYITPELSLSKTQKINPPSPQHKIFVYLLPHWLSFDTLIKWFWKMSRGSDSFMKSVKQFTDFHYKQFTTRHGQQLIDIFEFPIKLVLSPFTLAFDIAGSAPRGFGVPELISKLSYVSVFVSAFSFSSFSRNSIDSQCVYRKIKQFVIDNYLQNLWNVIFNAFKNFFFFLFSFGWLLNYWEHFRMNCCCLFLDGYECRLLLQLGPMILHLSWGRRWFVRGAFRYLLEFFILALRYHRW